MNFILAVVLELFGVELGELESNWLETMINGPWQRRRKGNKKSRIGGRRSFKCGQGAGSQLCASLLQTPGTPTCAVHPPEPVHGGCCTAVATAASTVAAGVELYPSPPGKLAPTL